MQGSKTFSLTSCICIGIKPKKLIFLLVIHVLPVLGCQKNILKKTIGTIYSRYISYAKKKEVKK